jgi:hypothetical protein
MKKIWRDIYLWVEYSSSKLQRTHWEAQQAKGESNHYACFQNKGWINTEDEDIIKNRGTNQTKTERAETKKKKRPRRTKKPRRTKGWSRQSKIKYAGYRESYAIFPRFIFHKSQHLDSRLLTCCRNPTLKLSPESPPLFTYQTRQKKQSLGINSYLRLAKNAPDLDSKQNQLREWRLETALLVSGLSGERNRINRFLNLNLMESGEWKGERGKWKGKGWRVDCGVSGHGWGVGSGEWALGIGRREWWVSIGTAINNSAWQVTNSFKFQFHVKSWNRYAFNVFYGLTRFYASLTGFDRFYWFSSFKPDFTRFMFFNS